LTSDPAAQGQAARAAAVGKLNLFS
jgi:hypothetical protein